MLSSRGQANADQLDIRWRFLPPGAPYDAGTNPEGLVSFATAENALVQGELEEFARKVGGILFRGGVVMLCQVRGVGDRRESVQCFRFVCLEFYMCCVLYI